MGWGTSFNTDVYINRVSVGNIQDAYAMINDCNDEIEDSIRTLIGLAIATPQKDREDSMTDMVNGIKSNVADYIEIIIDQATKRYQLELYVESKNENKAPSSTRGGIVDG